MSQDNLIEKVADQSGIELLPLNDVGNDGDMPAKKSDVDSYHSDSSLSSLGKDETEGGGRVAGARVKKPRIELIQVCTHMYLCCK